MEKQSMNNINDIDYTLTYEGYLWMSDKQHPKVFHPESQIDPALFTKKNPFVVEGYLFNKQTGLSLSIKYIDGQYHIYRNIVEKTDLDSQNKSKNVDTVYYLTQRIDIPSKRWAAFLRYWNEKADSSCLGMNVLEVEKEVFIGFKSKEK